MKKIKLILIAILSCFSILLINGCNSSNNNDDKIIGTYYAKISSPATIGNYLQEVKITKEKDIYYLQPANWIYKFNSNTESYEPNYYPMQKQQIQIKDNKFTAITATNTKTIYDIKENTIIGLQLDDSEQNITYTKSLDIAQDFIKNSETEIKKEQELKKSRVPKSKIFNVNSSKLQATLNTK